MTRFTSIDINGDKHFWRHEGRILEHHKQGEKWRVSDNNVTDPIVHIRLCRHINIVVQ